MRQEEIDNMKEEEGTPQFYLFDKGDLFMKRTLIISAFSACGKTYLFDNQDTLLFKNFEEKIHYSFLDSDSSQFAKYDGWEKEYVDRIEREIGTVDFIFVTQHSVVLEELKKRQLPFVMIFPNNIYGTEKEKQLIKNQWFGRIILRDNSFINEDFDQWFEHLKEKYDTWINEATINKYRPISFFVLNADQYLSDIIEDLYWKKETYDCYVR